jgi:glutaredoxin
VYDLHVKVARLFALLIAFAAAAASAQQYRWVDEKGGVHYTDTPPPASAKSGQKKNLRGNNVAAQPNYELDQAMKSSPVTLYSHPDCKEPCQMARQVLNKRGVPFTEVSAVDPAKVEQLKQVSGGITVPVLVLGGQIEKSISADAYNRALDSAGYPPPGTVRPRSQAAPAPPSVAEKP